MYSYLNIQVVQGVKVNTLGFNSRADAESKTSHTRESNSQRFRSYDFFLTTVNKLERKGEHCVFIEICC